MVDINSRVKSIVQSSKSSNCFNINFNLKKFKFKKFKLAEKGLLTHVFCY